MGNKRTAERIEFLANLLTDAIECNGYGFFTVKAWVYSDNAPEESYAVITEQEHADGETFRVDITTIAKGLSVIRKAIYATETRNGTDETHLYNAETFEPLYFGGDERSQLLLADRSNGDDGDYDVIGALAVLECALYGSVIYS